MALMTVCAWQCSGVWSDDDTDGRGEGEGNPVHALSDMHRITTLAETTQQIPPRFSQDILKCPSFCLHCLNTNKRINTDKQELQHTEHYYSNILGFILVALGAGR